MIGATARAATLEDVRAADYIRLHVVAEDDGDAAQALKLKARDAVLARARALLSDCECADDAWDIVVENAEALRAAAEDAVRLWGCDSAVTAQTGMFDFPDRQYGDTLVPAGRYRALRVVIGAGQGRNWWCVLYPSLCVPGDWESGEPVAFHSVILDWLRRLFGGDA